MDDNTANVAAPEPSDPVTEAVTSTDTTEGLPTDTGYPSAPSAALTDEPPFPDSIRFESGHPLELKAWIERWFDWKMNQPSHIPAIPPAAVTYEPYVPPDPLAVSSDVAPDAATSADQT